MSGFAGYVNGEHRSPTSELTLNYEYAPNELINLLSSNASQVAPEQPGYHPAYI